jgi:hypothetical protein
MSDAAQEVIEATEFIAAKAWDGQGRWAGQGVEDAWK